MMRFVDLNCDMGESFGAYSIGNDNEIMQYISSANIACGFHAGDSQVMRKTVLLAIKNKVSIGAHPSFPDLQGFGRREINMSQQEVYDITMYQVGSLYGFVKAANGKLTHVKPHGALYNMAARNKKMAEAIVKAIIEFDNTLILFGLAGSELINVAKSYGLKCCNEVFGDRTYQPDGSLTPRSQANALISDWHQSVQQVIGMVEEKSVRAVDGTIIPIEADTICIHGDGPNALELAKAIHTALKERDILIKSP
jgi:5-oxoprolinase (ATP-hydrolysing) subunit A